MAKVKTTDIIDKADSKPVNKTVPAGAAVRTGNGQDREEMIAIAAYYLAERRGFDESDPTQDWLDAEYEIDSSVYH
jgi:Protein of unknown function (DUF2934)